MSDVRPLRKSVLLVVSWLLLCSAASLPAGEVRDLYRAEIPVKGQDAGERSQAIEQGLLAVLVKVTGRRQLQDIEAIQQALAAPMKYVQRFRYQNSDKPLITMTATGEEVIYHQRLLVDFDDQALSGVLREAGLPVWGRARPTVLLWVAVEDWNNRQILGGDMPGMQGDVLENKAVERGIPVLFPLLDLEDQAGLRFADIWGDFQDDIRRASQRYQPGAILVGRVYRQSADEWQGRWTLYQDKPPRHWSTDGASQQQVLLAAIDTMADALGEQFAMAGDQSASGRLDVTIQDVRSLAQYARAMKYLASIDAVSDVNVNEVDDSQASFRLSLRGNRVAFEQAVAFGETLAPVETVSTIAGQAVGDEPLEPAALQYRLLP